MILLLPAGAYFAYRTYEWNYGNLPYFNTSGTGSVAEKSAPVIPFFSFTNQDGKAITLKETRNKITVFNFFFATCRTICPDMLTNETKVAKAFAENQRVNLLSITVDPENDTRELLEAYSREYRKLSSHWHFLTGEKPAIYRFARKGLNVTATDGDGGPDDFIHSEFLILVDGDGKLRGYYSGTEENRVDDLIADIQKLL